MTNTAHTVDGTAALPGARASIAATLRHHRVALLIALAVMVLTAIAVVQLRSTTVTANAPASVRQAERAELERLGVTSYDQLPAVQRSQERYGVPPARQHDELRRMEEAELRRYRNRTTAERAAADPRIPQTAADPRIRQMERRTGSSPDQ